MAFPQRSGARAAGNAARRPSTGLVSRGGAIGAMIFILRIIAILLMTASTFGNYVQFVGGWPHYWPLDWPVLGAALLYQLLCCLLQWGFKSGRMWLPYMIALVASAIPSFLTYNGLFGPYLATQVGAPLTLLCVALAVIGGDAFPEWVLVD